MKILNKLSAVACLCWVALIACESPDFDSGRTAQVNGLMNVTIQIPGDPSKYVATKTGPYEENEEILVKVPTTDENPLDVTRLICMVNVEHNCYVTPAVGGEMDFTDPYPITVVDALGNKHHNTIRVVPTPPKTKFAKLWGQSAEQMQTSGDPTGIALWKDYVAVQVYNGNIKLYDRETGAFIDEIESASSFMMRARTDDAGHLLTNRENVYGAGFMVYLYNDETQEHTNILNYTADAGCPKDLGHNFSVKGDVTKGVAYIYGTCPNKMEVYYWKLIDGELQTPESNPNVLRFGPAGGNWTSAPMIQRASLADDSDHYIFVNRRSGNPDDHPELMSKFSLFTSSFEVTSLNQDSHFYRILGFNVFNVENDTYLALADEFTDPWSGGPSTLRVFDITNPKKMELGPDDAGYDKLLLFKSEDTPGYTTNYNDWGDVASHIIPSSVGYDIYIATGLIGSSNAESHVRVYKMTWFRQ